MTHKEQKRRPIIKWFLSIIRTILYAKKIISKFGSGSNPNQTYVEAKKSPPSPSALLTLRFASLLMDGSIHPSLTDVRTYLYSTSLVFFITVPVRTVRYIQSILSLVQSSLVQWRLSSYHYSCTYCTVLLVLYKCLYFSVVLWKMKDRRTASKGGRLVEAVWKEYDLLVWRWTNK